jgi:hypothetical protein
MLTGPTITTTFTSARTMAVSAPSSCVSKAANFFEKVIVHFHDGSHEELVIRDRIPAGGQTRAIDLPGERRVIESVELWYGKARWEHRPKVALFGLR